MNQFQGTDAWHADRLGKVTASRVADVIARTQKGAWTAKRGDYLAELVAERLTVARTRKFVTPAMAWGKQTEDEARAFYEFMEDVDVELVGLIDHPTIPMSGASPDGQVALDGLLETKCPTTQKHLDVLATRIVPADHVTQMQWQMACTGRAWCDYVSYDPRMPEHLRYFRQRVLRDDTVIAELEVHVLDFLAEVDAKIAGLGAVAEAA